MRMTASDILAFPAGPPVGVGVNVRSLMKIRVCFNETTPLTGAVATYAKTLAFTPIESNANAKTIILSRNDLHQILQLCSSGQDPSIKPSYQASALYHTGLLESYCG
jgi:hypothetical protein